jgi:hypothetical protein
VDVKTSYRNSKFGALDFVLIPISTEQSDRVTVWIDYDNPHCFLQIPLEQMTETAMPGVIHGLGKRRIFQEASTPYSSLNASLKGCAQLVTKPVSPSTPNAFNTARSAAVTPLAEYNRIARATGTGEKQ